MPREENQGGDGLKICARCGETLPPSAFRLDRSKWDGRYPRCKLCCGTALVKVTYRYPCDNCGVYFKPRHNKGIHVRFCSRRCMNTAQRGAEHHSWKGAVIGYGAAHYRIRSVRGDPSRCERCNATGRGMHWALDHERCTQPLLSSQGPYSPDPAHYVAMCVPCHKTMDVRRP